jgi:hypothetical protein
MVVRRVSDRSSTARGRLLVSFALTLTALMVTFMFSLAHTDYTVMGLCLTGMGIFATTWFLLDVCIAWQDDLQRRRRVR